MSLDSIPKKLDECAAYLEGLGGGTVVEGLLKKSLLIEMCSEYEKEIQKIIVMRAKKSDDREIEAFVETTVRMQRHLQLNDISNILAKFNVHRKTYFCTKISGMRIGYDTMVNNRNSGAHGGPINITLNQLRSYHENACGVMAAFSDALFR